MLGLISCHGAGGGAVTPDVPTGFAAVPGSLNIAELSWDLVPGVSTNIYADGVLVDTVPAGTNTYSFTGSTPGTIYDFQISAVNMGLESELTAAITCATGEPFTGVLDAFTTGALEFWSHRRKLVSSYSGDLLQGRRTSDDAPIDVSALASGEIDEAGLLSFAGSSSVAVAAVYGQLSGHDLLQGTADVQRMIIDSGSLVTVGGKAASRGLRVPSGTPDHGGALLTSTFATYSGSTLTLFLRGAHGVYSGIFNAVVDAYVSFGKNGSFGNSAARTALYHGHVTGAPGLAGVGNFSGAFNADYLVSVIWDGSTVTFRDGTNTYTLSQPAGFDFNQFALAYFAGGSTNYASDANRIQEVAIWLSDQTSNEAAIRSAMLA